MELDWSSLTIISRLNVHADWKEIKKIIENYFEATFVLNPFMADEGLLQIEDGRILRGLGP